MTMLQAIILGIVQGLTEFIPVSSSAHLVIVPYLLKWQIPQDQAFIFDVLVQLFTLIAVIIYFWHDLVEIFKAFILGIIQRRPFESPHAKLGWLLILATIPAGLLGILIKDLVEQAFSNVLMTGVFLIVTAGLLVIADKFTRGSRQIGDLAWKDAVWVGLFQALAIFPGISRSGATITGGVVRGLDRRTAARFAFLMSIPVMLAAGFLASLDLIKTPAPTSNLLVFIPGFVAAAVIGYLSIRWLLRYLENHPLVDFAIYCFILGLVTIVTVLIRG